MVSNSFINFDKKTKNVLKMLTRMSIPDHNKNLIESKILKKS